MQTSERAQSRENWNQNPYHHPQTCSLHMTKNSQEKSRQEFLRKQNLYIWIRFIFKCFIVSCLKCYFFRRHGKNQGENNQQRDFFLEPPLVREAWISSILQNWRYPYDFHLDPDHVDLTISSEDVIVSGSDDNDVRVLTNLDIASLLTEGLNILFLAAKLKH